MLRLCLTLLTALVLTTTGTALRADGPWQGEWKAHNTNAMSLIQDGTRVWGDYGDTRLIEGNISPDGTRFHGTWLYDDGRWGTMWFALNADMSGFAGYWADEDTLPLNSSSGWSARRLSDVPEPLIYATGTGRFWPAELDIDAPGMRAFLTFDGAVPFEAGRANGGNIPVDVPPGNAGVYNVSFKGDLIGAVGFDQIPDGFRARGPARIQSYAGSTELELEINVDYRAGDAILRIGTPSAPEQDTVLRVRVREMEGDQYQLTTVDRFLGQNDQIFSLNLRNGSIPAKVPLPGDPVRLRRFPIGLAAEVRSGPNLTDPVIGHLLRGTSGMTIDYCFPQISPDQFALNGEELRQSLKSSMCRVSGVQPSGFVQGALITR